VRAAAGQMGGKSTLIKAILGQLKKPWSSELTLNEKNIKIFPMVSFPNIVCGAFEPVLQVI
jgi:ABC-type cobalamin/Fe3+-siderophores transport system ATPase subunit